MTGKSFGLRSASYGSLQPKPPPPPLLLHNEIAIRIQSPPLSGRKPPKMLLPGSREKERFLQRICKITARRKIRMLLLLIVSVAVCCSLFSVITKDEDATSSIEDGLGFSRRAQIFVNPGQRSSSNTTAPLIPLEEQKVNTGSVTNKESSQFRLPVLVTSLSAAFTQHPCVNFSFTPPSLDRKRSGPRPCPVCYVTVEQAMALVPPVTTASPVLKTLNYVTEDALVANESNGGSMFGGHPSLQQRDESFNIKETMTVHCGFAKGKKPGRGTGFDIEEADLLEMEQCYGIVVASAIFGNYDIMQEPKNVSEFSMRTVCFYMFVDEETESFIKKSTMLDSIKRVGSWRVVVVRNLPSLDARRNGKVPKLLLHRLFPNVRFSIWIDGKLELVRDPFQILERFLWRKNITFAISRHYRRFDVFEEAEANKAAGKYNNASIDNQIEFYKREGLTHYSAAKFPITSDVPEGCVIIREHIPITNIFTCLWFNEVDRFTSRDQLSFSTVRDKIRSKVNWVPDMFMDCERRDFVVQAYHRDVLVQRLAALRNRPPPVAIHEPSRKLIPETGKNELGKTSPPGGKLPVKMPVKRGRDKKSGSRRHRSRTAIGKGISSL